MITIRHIFEQCFKRTQRWHKAGIEEWTLLEWVACMAGEAGEATNKAKKVRRLECGNASINEEGRHYTDIEIAKLAVVEEVADVLFYAVLAVARAKVSCEDFEAILCRVFNRKSIEYEFPERLQLEADEDTGYIATGLTKLNSLVVQIESANYEERYLRGRILNLSGWAPGRWNFMGKHLAGIHEYNLDMETIEFRPKSVEPHPLARQLGL